MKIASNTGPIIGLAKIDLLFVLNQIASEVFIPPMVYRELMGKTGPETAQIDKALKEFLKAADLKPWTPLLKLPFQLWTKEKERLSALVQRPPGIF